MFNMRIEFQFIQQLFFKNKTSFDMIQKWYAPQWISLKCSFIKKDD